MTSSTQTTLQKLRGIWCFFDKSDRKRFIFLYFLMLVNGLLEIAGLAAIFPVVSILTSDTWQQQWPMLTSIQQWMNMPGRGDFAIALMFGLFIYFLFRNAFRIWVIWRSLRLVAAIESRMVNRLVESVLSQSYSWLSKRNASQHLQLINDDSGKVINFLRDSVIFFTEATSTLGIILLLVYSQPLIFIMLVAFLALPAYIFQRSVRGYLNRISDRMRLLAVSSMTSLREALAAIKEVKVAGCERYTTLNHSQQNDEVIRLHRNNSVIRELPKIILENAFLGGMVVVIALHVGLHDTASGSLSYLGVLAIAGFRAVPVVNKGIHFLSELRFCSASTEAVKEQLQQQKEPEQTANKQLFDPMHNLQFESINFRYESKGNNVLSDVDMEIKHGEMIGIIGASGSGKTTLVDILLGLLMPDSGKVLVNGVDISEDPAQWRQKTAYVPQSTFLVDKDIRHNIAFAVDDHLIDDDLVNQAVKGAQLSDVVAALPEGVNALVGESGVRLSGGQRQRIGIARALYRQPQLLVLDEATSALDSATEAQFMETVESMHSSCTMVIIAHRLTTIAHCDRVYRLEGGRMVQVDPANL